MERDNVHDSYARGYRRLTSDASVTLHRTKFFPGTATERRKLLDYVGTGYRVYCVEVPAGVLVAARAGDPDGHAVVLTGRR